MIKISPINPSLTTQYKKDVFPRVKEFLTNTGDPMYAPVLQYLNTNGQLDDQKVETLLTGELPDLLDAIKKIGTIKTEGKNEGFHRLYKNFTNRILGKAWGEKIGVKICPYCNRSYIFTLKNGGTRPQYDHFFPKSLYPYLALSMYNLIPCCPVCNSIKTDFDPFDPKTKKENFIYPYRDYYGTQISFSVVANGTFGPWLGCSDDFEIKLTTDQTINPELYFKAQNTVKQLKLEELYNKHKDYVQDIIRTTYIYDENYCSTLFTSFPELFSSVQDVENLVFMNYLDEKNWDKRVLAKLSHDIKDEILNGPYHSLIL